MLVPLDLPPGIVRKGTEYDSRGRWYDANLIRFYRGELQPIGGWQRTTETALTGRARALHAWRDNNFKKFTAIGTEGRLYFMDDDGVTDITPDDLVVGYEYSVAGLGYGAGAFDNSTYDTPRLNTSLTLEATVWSFANFGQVLVACSNGDGRIFKWDPATMWGANLTDAAVIANAPIDNYGILVTNERHLFALGANADPRLIKWSDREDYTTWAPTATNTAGDLTLQTTGSIKCGRKVGTEVLIWTDQDLHRIDFLGSPLVYGANQIGADCGIAGPNAVAVTMDFAVWMSDNGFYFYDGYVKPLPCDVQDYVFTDMNRTQRAQFTAGLNSQFQEVWFFYASKNSIYNDRYAIWNYAENHWSIGQLERTSWLDRGVYDYPMACGQDGHIYLHENGYTDDGNTRVGDVFATSGPYDISNGDKNMVVTQLIPAGCPNTPTCTKVSFELQQAPHGPTTTAGPYTFNRSDGFADARFTARQLQLKMEATQDKAFRFGTLRMETKQGGGR